MTKIENIEFLNVNETAQVLHVSPNTVRRYIKIGQIPSVKLGQVLIKVSDICQLLGCESIDTSRFEIEHEC